MTNENIKIISDKEILHPAAFDVGPRITRVQVVKVGEIVEEHSFWTQNGQLLKVDARRIWPEPEPVTFELYMPAPNTQPDLCGWVHTPLPRGGMFEHVSWGMHASTSGIMHRPGERVVFHPTIDAITGFEPCAFIKSAGGYDIVKTN